jgi:hypothetical protein
MPPAVGGAYNDDDHRLGRPVVGTELADISRSKGNPLPDEMFSPANTR